MVKTTEVIHLAIPIGMTDRIDRVRGDVPRSKFVSRLLEKALNKLEGKNK